MDCKQESKLLKFLYNTVPGRMVLRILISPAISKIGGAYMNCAVSKIHIKSFIRKNNIDMNLYENEKYKNFNDFFTRKIKKENRPFDMSDDAFVSPCDGKLSAYKVIDEACFEIKGSLYTIDDLLKGSKYCNLYKDGICLVFRLCVDNYHRYLYLDDGQILENKPVKGKLHTVRPIALEKYPVFVQNAREYTVIETKNFGVVSQIEVGALMIGKIKNHQTEGDVFRGEEKGMFLYGGSTIVVLLQEGVARIDNELFVATENNIETPVVAGQRIGTKIKHN